MCHVLGWMLEGAVEYLRATEAWVRRRGRAVSSGRRVLRLTVTVSSNWSALPLLPSQLYHIARSEPL